MTHRLPRVLDAPALVALVHARQPMLDLLQQAEAGWSNLMLPAACIADAEAVLGAGPSAGSRFC